MAVDAESSRKDCVIMTGRRPFVQEPARRGDGVYGRGHGGFQQVVRDGDDDDDDDDDDGDDDGDDDDDDNLAVSTHCASSESN
jgi:hypothetical protein